LNHLKNITNFDWIIENSHTLYGKLLINLLTKISTSKIELINEYDTFIKKIECNTYNSLNFLIHSDNVLAQRHYMSNRYNNLIIDSIFQKDEINVCDNIVYHVFEHNFDYSKSLKIDSTNDDIEFDYKNVNNSFFILMLPSKQKAYHLRIEQKETNEFLAIFNSHYFDKIYIFPKNFKIAEPIFIDIKPSISIDDIKFIITNTYVSQTEVLVVIRRSDCDWGWHENLYLEVVIDNKEFFFFVGKSSENTLKIIIEIPEVQFQKINLDYQQKIPKIIFQTWKTHHLETELLNSVLSIKEKNPEYDYFLYDDDECEEFIRTNFDDDVLFAYNNLMPGAFKADLFRYCVLYKNGGIYIDCKMVNIIPFRQVIEPDVEIILVNDSFQKDMENLHGIYNAFICSVPGKSFFKKAIDTIVCNVKNLVLPTNPLLVTGPTLLLNCYLADRKTNFKIFIHPYLGYDSENHNNGIFSDKKELFMYKTFKNYYKLYRGGGYICEFKRGFLYKNILTMFEVYSVKKPENILSIAFEYCLGSLINLQNLLNTHAIIEINVHDENSKILIGNTPIPTHFEINLVERITIDENTEKTLFFT
jgi:mannosyltransferase OCH1-like enzyme